MCLNEINKSLSSVTRARVFSAYSIISYTYKHSCLLLKNHIVQCTDTRWYIQTKHGCKIAADFMGSASQMARLDSTWGDLRLSWWCLVSEHWTASAEWKCNFLERSSFGLRHPQAHKNEGHGTHGSIDSKSSWSKQVMVRSDVARERDMLQVIRTAGYLHCSSSTSSLPS